MEKALRESESEVEVARTKLAQLKAGPKQSDIDQQKAEIARWETEYDMAAADEKRYMMLREQEIASLDDLLVRRLNAERAKRALERAREKLKSIEAIRTELARRRRARWCDRADTCSGTGSENSRVSWRRGGQPGNTGTVEGPPYSASTTIQHVRINHRRADRRVPEVEQQQGDQVRVPGVVPIDLVPKFASHNKVVAI